MKPVYASLFLLLFVVACTQAPQPFRHGYTGADTSGLRLRDGGTVVILPVEGTPRPLGQMIATNLADSLAVRNIPATSNQIENPAYRLRAQVVSTYRKTNTVFKGTIIWSVIDRGGNVVQETQQPLEMDQRLWDFGDPAMLAELTEAAADDFASYVQDASEMEAVELAEMDRPPVFYISAISGAPGDGAASLKKAMDLTLRQYGAQVKSSAEGASYLLKSDVDVFDPFEGQQRVKIQWILSDATGQELGRTTQANRMAEGSFDGKWGKLSYLISRAAIPGIGEMVERHKQELRWARSRENQTTTTLPGQRSRIEMPPF